MVVLQSDSTDFKVLDKKLILNLIEEYRYHAGDDKKYIGVRFKREGQIPGMRGWGEQALVGCVVQLFRWRPSKPSGSNSEYKVYGIHHKRLNYERGLRVEVTSYARMLRTTGYMLSHRGLLYQRTKKGR